jgi:hypothetical protein
MASDRELGIYYPAPIKIENYRARMRILPSANRITRLEFIQKIALGLQNKPYPAQFSIFSKGVNAEKIIIISNFDGRLDTIYRVRAALVNIAVLGRKMPIFRKFGTEVVLTFLDIGKMLGFKKITVSDGDKYTYQVLLK